MRKKDSVYSIENMGGTKDYLTHSRERTVKSWFTFSKYYTTSFFSAGLATMNHFYLKLFYPIAVSSIA